MTPTFVLTRPQMGENIGMAARAMLNFGVDRMRIVDPRDGWPNQAAVALASGAGRVLDGATVHDDLAGALADCTYVYATTARQRDLTKDVFSPEAAMRDAAARIAAGGHVAVMFGPERAGLENEDIAQANALISVPVNPEFPSLNLAQCVLLVGYEWMRVSGEVTAQTTELAGGQWATQDEIHHLSRHFEDRLEAAGFFFPEHKSESMRLNLRNMWSRMPLTRADVQTLHGMLRQMVRWATRR
ncbi:RNA methyltransferase [uncultured Tateyamaria sp.]|uniref:RNA methyltransferase n=1 Tax=uncultured Tateyamaria sp. TaxID=455651 RepID=UPI002629380A|nr:RNA methyltransferase [uncultured Tateyamaria sp.]